MSKVRHDASGKRRAAAAYANMSAFDGEKCTMKAEEKERRSSYETKRTLKRNQVAEQTKSPDLVDALRLFVNMLTERPRMFALITRFFACQHNERVVQIRLKVTSRS